MGSRLPPFNWRRKRRPVTIDHPSNGSVLFTSLRGPLGKGWKRKAQRELCGSGCVGVYHGYVIKAPRPWISYKEMAEILQSLPPSIAEGR